jgi:hypothetical protein
MTAILDEICLVIKLPSIVVLLGTETLFLVHFLKVQIFYVAIIKLEPLLFVQLSPICFCTPLTVNVDVR